MKYSFNPLPASDACMCQPTLIIMKKIISKVNYTCGFTKVFDVGTKFEQHEQLWDPMMFRVCLRRDIE